MQGEKEEEEEEDEEEEKERERGGAPVMPRNPYAFTPTLMNQWMNESTLPYFSARGCNVSAGQSDIFARRWRQQPPSSATASDGSSPGDDVGVADSISTHVSRR